MNIHDATEAAYKRGYEDGKTKWISVKDRLPELYETVHIAVLSHNGYEEPAYFTTMGFVDAKERNGLTAFTPLAKGETITHWMPLPEPPEVEE